MGMRKVMPLRKGTIVPQFEGGFEARKWPQVIREITIKEELQVGKSSEVKRSPNMVAGAL
jgi:hypothetical protein